MANYTELLCSLPHLPDPFRRTQRLLSRVQLEKRMHMLEIGDQVLMRRIWRVQLWSGIELSVTDREIVQRHLQLLADINDPQLQEFLQWRMALRILLAALRRRKLELGPPADLNDWAADPIAHLLVQRWNQEDFGLSARYPWLSQAAALLQEGQSFALERLLLQYLWHYLGQWTPSQTKGFAAVYRYVAKWDVCARVYNYHNPRVLERFQHLVAASLVGHNVPCAAPIRRITSTEYSAL